MDIARRLEVVEQENLLLREKVAFLEALTMATATLPVEWRLTPSEARVFGALVNREVTTKTAILAALYSDRPAEDEAEAKIVDVFICKLRKKVFPFGIAIRTVWGQGYALDAETRAAYRVRRAA